MPGQDDLWAWLQQVGGNDSWLSQPYGGHSTNYGPPKGGPGSAGDDGGFNNPYQAAANAPALAMMPPRTPTPPTFHWPDSSTPTGMPTPSTDITLPSFTVAGSPSATPKGPLAGQGATATPMKRRAGAPNLGYYQGDPRFSTFKYETPNSTASRAPIYTAMNLGGPIPFGPFGGGGQQPAANPNAPSPAAQPVSSPVYNNPGIRPADPLPASAEDNAPWWMGPLQQGNIWKGSGGPSGRINR